MFLLCILGSLNLDTVHSILGDDVEEHTSPIKVGMDVFGATLYTSLLCSALSSVSSLKYHR